MVLLGCLAGYLAATALLVLVVRDRGAVAVVSALAPALGTTAPPVAVMMRSIWHSSTDARTLTTAMALDSAMMGSALITGPVLASWLSPSFSGIVPFVVIALLMAGVVGLLINSPSVPRPSRSGHWLGPLASAPLRRLPVADALFVIAVTATDVVLPIYAKEYDAVAYSGAYPGALSIGSVLGGLTLGALPGLLSRGPKVSVLLCGFAVGVASPAPTARLSPLAVLLVCPVAGLVIGAAFGTLRTVGGDLAPEGRVTETMSWLSSLDMVGSAVGAAVFAHLATASGSRTALLLIPAVVLLAAVIGWNARTREPQPVVEAQHADA